MQEVKGETNPGVCPFSPFCAALRFGAWVFRDLRFRF